MKLIDKYYKKLYKETEKITKKLFGKNITDARRFRNDVRKEIEAVIKKSISEITNEDIISNKLGYKYAQYRTLCNVLEVVESACVLKTFTIEEYENEC